MGGEARWSTTNMAMMMVMMMAGRWRSI
jgi:hypothetical protein